LNIQPVRKVIFWQLKRRLKCEDKEAEEIKDAITKQYMYEVIPGSGE
jgi:hypothetical protein